jgi:hypothetical protein
MQLAALLREIEGSPGAVTIGDLARRLETSPARVSAMLAALRASGRIGPDGTRQPGTDDCASSGSCAVSCPGPSECPFTLEFGGFLEIRT